MPRECASLKLLNGLYPRAAIALLPYIQAAFTRERRLSEGKRQTPWNVAHIRLVLTFCQFSASLEMFAKMFNAVQPDPILAAHRLKVFDAHSKAMPTDPSQVDKFELWTQEFAYNLVLSPPSYSKCTPVMANSRLCSRVISMHAPTKLLMML